MIKICMVKDNMTKMDGVIRVLSLLERELSPFYEVHILSILGIDSNKPDFETDIKILAKGKSQLRSALISGSVGLHRYLKQNKMDVVMAIGGSSIPVVIGGTLGLPIKKVYCEHINLYAASRNKTDYGIRKLGVSHFDRIITLTERDRKMYLREFPKLEKKQVQCIYNWVDDRLLENSSSYNVNSKKIVTVGRLSEQKGYYDLIEIAYKVLKDHPDWEWDIYGDGPEKTQMEKTIYRLKMEGQLHLKGNVSDMYERYTQYAIYAMTSKFEGLPMVLLEAKARRLPIISFQCMTGPEEIIEEGINGYLISVDNQEEYVVRLNELINEDSKRLLFSENSLHNVEKFEKNRIVKQWKDMLNCLMDKEEK